MELTKKAILRSVTPDASGTVFFDIMLAVTEGDAILGSRTHSGSIEVGADADQRIGFVLDHFARGLDLTNPDGAKHTVAYPRLSNADVAAIRDAVAKEATPERLAALAKKRAADEAEHAAEQKRQHEEAQAKAAADDEALTNRAKQLLKAAGLDLDAGSKSLAHK